MLKEKLYVEYQRRYKDYIAANNKVDGLKAEAESIRREGVDEKNSIERKKAEIERQLLSVKKEGIKSSFFQKYSERKCKEIKSIEERITKLKNDRKIERRNLEAKKKDTVKSFLENLLSDEILCQKRLNDLIGGGDEKIDENQLRLKLLQDKEHEVAALVSQYDAEIAKVQDSLQGIDDEYSAILQWELAYVANNEKLQTVYSGLSVKMAADELPMVISNSLEEPVEKMISRRGLDGGESVARLSAMAGALDDMRQYTPGWVDNLVTFGFPAFVGIMLFFIFMGASLSFVATATNAIVTFLFRILCTALGFGIVFAILRAAKGKIAGIIGGVIAGIICFMIASDWAVALPYSVINAVEWVVKFIICFMISVGLFFLNTKTNVGNRLIDLGMKIGFVRKAALKKQGYTIQANVDSYYALLRYREIIAAIVESNKRQREASIRGEITRLTDEKNTSVETLAEYIDKNLEGTVAGIVTETDRYNRMLLSVTADFDRKILDDQKRLQELRNSMASDKDSLISQLERRSSDCDDEIRKIIEKYNGRVADKEKMIQELQAGFKPEFDAMNELFMKIYKAGSPELEETEGVVSDKFYIFNGKEAPESAESLIPIRLYEIRHRKNPIVFLYDSMDSSKIASELHDFMDAINIGLYTINCNKIYELYITDPVSKGINFKDQEKRGRLRIVDDIKELYDIISDSMNFVASKGHQLTIDELNRGLIREGNDEEDINKFGKYRVVQFVVPEEESNQTTDFFNNDIWTKFETCKKHGFLPIFYIKRTEWDAALNNNEKFNSKFISKLNKALGVDKDQKNIYSIDTQKISIQRYEG